MRSEQIISIAEEVKTPLYLFDAKALQDRVEYLRRLLPKEIELCYAMKANAFLIEVLSPLVDRFEVCSPGEYDICRRCGIPMKKLVISGVYKAYPDTLRMVGDQEEIGWYTVESMSQFKDLALLAEQNKREIHVLLRLTSGNQFGLNKEEIRSILEKRLKYYYLDIAGLQYFSGTQKKLRRIQKELLQLQDFLKELKRDVDYVPKEIEYGAGLPIYYFRKNPMATEEENNENLRRELQEEEELLQGLGTALEPLMEKSHITLELGRSIAADCGSYVTRVVDTKCNGGQNYAIVDGGIHHITYYGQMMAMKLPYLRRLNEREKGETQEWNICGSLCTVNDLIIKQLPIAELKVGDLFAFERAGAYCASEGISLFLSRALPAVVLLREDGSYQTLRPHTDTYPLNSPV